MKKIILLTILSTAIAFTSCKKKSDEPTPASSNNTTGNPSTGGGGTTTPATTSGSLTIGSGSATNLTVQTVSMGAYVLMGTTSSGTTALSASFFTKPTASSTINLSETTTFLLSYTSGSNSYLASSGTANVTVSGTATTVSFTNVVFTNVSNSSTVTLSGSLYTSK